MQVQISKLEAPIPPSAENNGRKSFRITAIDGIKYFASPKIGMTQVQEGDLIDIEISEDKYGNKWINKFAPIKDVNADIKNTFPDSKVVTTNGYVQIQPKKNGYDLNTITSKDWLIWIQSTVNRYADWTPNQKMKWSLEKFEDGPITTLKKLSESSDSF